MNPSTSKVVSLGGAIVGGILIAAGSLLFAMLLFGKAETSTVPLLLILVSAGLVVLAVSGWYLGKAIEADRAGTGRGPAIDRRETSFLGRASVRTLRRLRLVTAVLVGLGLVNVVISAIRLGDGGDDHGYQVVRLCLISVGVLVSAVLVLAIWRRLRAVDSE